MDTVLICKEIGRICYIGVIQDAANRLRVRLRGCSTKAQQLVAFIEVAQSLE